MKRIGTLLTFTLVVSSTFSQVVEAEETLRKQKTDTTLGWRKGAIINVGIAQVSLTNWVAGGQSSIATNALVSLFANKRIKKGLWENQLDMGYGILKQGEVNSLRKTDDRIELVSKYGQKINNEWYYAALFNFKTQFTDGFNYPDISNPISRLMAPGYMLFALGIEHRPSDKFNMFLAPLTSKNTFVLDETLSNIGSFGVAQGEKFRTEFGGYLRINYKTKIMENVGLQTRIDLFSNYLNNPQNIDVNWETLIDLKVNKYISATIGTHIIYDDDIMIAVDRDKDGVLDGVGPRVQFKQLLNVGFSYKF
jgi:hypothetical protein